MSANSNTPASKTPGSSLEATEAAMIECSDMEQPCKPDENIGKKSPASFVPDSLSIPTTKGSLKWFQQKHKQWQNSPKTRLSPTTQAPRQTSVQPITAQNPFSLPAALPGAADLSDLSGGKDAKEKVMSSKDLWVHKILPFLGVGHYLYMSLVSKQFKENYLAFFNTLPSIETAYMVVGSGITVEHKGTLPMMNMFPNWITHCPTLATSTFYSAVFSSVSCAEYWYKISEGEDHRLGIRDEEREGWCPGPGVIATIAKHGKLPVLLWAQQQGFEWNEDIRRPFSFSTDACSAAAGGGHLHILKYLHENSCPWSEWTFASAAKGGNLEVLKYLRTNRCPWDKAACEEAAGNGHLECLQWLHENYYPWDKETCVRAAGGGHLNCLQYLHEQECPWEESTCTWAAHNGNLECLKYAHKNGCPWDLETGREAAENGHLEVLKYARNSECPWWDAEFIRDTARDFGPQEILDWLDTLPED